MNGGNYLTISTRNIILNEHWLVYIYILQHSELIWSTVPKVTALLYKLRKISIFSFLCIVLLMIVFFFFFLIVSPSSIYSFCLFLWVSPTFGHCMICSFSLCGLPVEYLQQLAIVLYVLSRFVVYPLGIINCWPLYCMFFLALWFTRWVSSTFGHCIVCSFSLCGLPVGYHQLLAIVLYVLSRFVVYPLGIINLWPLYCMFFLALWFTRWVSSTFGHYIVCFSSVYGFYLPF